MTADRAAVLNAEAKPRHRCGRELSWIRGEWYCMTCFVTVEVPAMTPEEAAREVTPEPGKQRHVSAHISLGPAWTAEERETWATWKEGDPIPGEESKVEPEDTGLKTLDTKALGERCIETLRYYQEQIALLDAKAARIREEAAKLVQIAQFAGVTVPEQLVAMARVRTAAKATKKRKADVVPRADGLGPNEWQCPHCNHRTVSRWVERHKSECAGWSSAA